MRSATLSIAFLIAAGASAVSISACSSSNSSNGGSSGTGATGGTDGGGATGGTGGTGATGGTGGTGAKDGGAGDGNDTKDTASPLTLGTTVQAKLDPAGTDIDWYKFDGTKDQAISIVTQAKTGTDPFDPTYLDLVVTLFDANGTQLAEQDDPTPPNSNDPLLFTVLPAAGSYYLRVLECNAWSKGGAANCADVTKITNKNYSLVVSEMTFSSAGEVKEVEPNNDATTATPLTYQKNPNSAGHYYLSTIYGGFSDANDVDVYSLTVPTDLAIDAGSRAVGSFYLQPPTTNGDGSSTSPGEVHLTTAADPATMIAQVDDSTGASLDVPLLAGTQYLVFYKRAAQPTGAQDFYFDLSGFGTSNPLEQDDAGNNTAVGAEVLVQSTTSPGSFFIEGDLAPASADVDHFSFAVPATNADQVSVACGAQRSGSGLRGFTVDLLDSAGTPVVGASATEAADKDLLLDKIVTPSGQSKLLLKLSATSQAVDVTSTFYRCGVHFSAKTN